MVSLRGFEPPFSTFARLRVLHLRYRLLNWRKRSDSNAHRISPGTLARCCHTIRRRFQNFRLPIANSQLCFWSHVLRSLFPFPKHRQGISIVSFSAQSAIGNRKLAMNWRKVKESNPRDALLGLVFKTSCAPPRATFQIGWDARI